ncbi:hypothetical protein ACLB2K_027294 [Fragaria x ananassa]
MELLIPIIDANMLMSLAVIGVVLLFLHLYNALVVRPKRLRSMITKQGISGPSPAFLLGNIMDIKKAARPSSITKAATSEPLTYHNCAAVLFPFFEQWRKQYGEVFVFALGNTQILYVNKPEAVKEITTCTSWDLGKPSYQYKERRPLLGHGILTSNGASWAHQRKIIAPELYMQKVKGMINLITESTMSLVDSWNSKIEAQRGIADIKMDQCMKSFSGDIISRACFGSNYLKGEEIFQKLTDLQEAMARKLFLTGIPGLRHLPTKSNREAWALEKEAATLILQVVKERQAAGYEKDLLQMILEETTAVTATWCLMLLASNQEWQERVRAEVLQVCEGRIPDADMLLKMKQLTMVIHESLRLYPPNTVVSREALKDLKFGDIRVPKGVNIWTNVVTLHTDPEIWGPDSYTFKPERFANGISGACKLPYLYMPFGIGPRICLGQNFAMVELKILIALILSNFSFSLSPKYIHKPSLKLVIEPEHGVDLLVKKL